jgi:hypothetical protein
VICAGFSGPEERSLGGRWSIADYVHAYTTGAVTPSQVAENIIKLLADSERADPPMRFLISFNAADLRANALASTQRYVACCLGALISKPSTLTCEALFLRSCVAPIARHLRCRFRYEAL